MPKVTREWPAGIASHRLRGRYSRALAGWPRGGALACVQCGTGRKDRPDTRGPCPTRRRRGGDGT